MSNKLIKNKEIEVKNIREEVKFNVKDLIIAIIILGVTVLKELYIEIPEFLQMTMHGTATVVVTILSIVIFIAIAILCGSYQSKVEGENITVASVLNDKNRPYYTPSEKVIKFINGLLRTTIIALAGCLLNISLSTITMIFSVLVVLISTYKNKFKIMDIGYTAYTIGMLGFIITNLRA